jgi:hypothetical protein
MAVLLLPVEWRHVGLAASTVLCAFFSAAMLIHFAVLKNGSLGLLSSIKPIAKILFASCVMGLAVYFVKPYLCQLRPIVSLVVLLFVGVGVYGVLALPLLGMGAFRKER